MSDTAIQPPNYTQVPNAILDNMASLSDVELRVMLAACRQTFGWHRERATMSNSFLVKATGKSNQGVRNGVNKSIERKWLKKVGTGKRGVSIYGINFDDPPTELSSTPQLSREDPPNSVDPKKKGKDNLKKKDSSASVGCDSSNGVGEESQKCIDYHRITKPKKTGDCSCLDCGEVMKVRGDVENYVDNCPECNTRVEVQVSTASGWVYLFCPKCDGLLPSLEQPNPFQDKNHPDAPAPTPLHEKIPATPTNGFPRQPRIELPDGPEYQNGDIKPGPMQSQQKPDSVKDTPIAEKAPTSTAPEVVAVEATMPETEPEAEEEKPKTPHQRMQQAIIWAMGWTDQPILEWGQINKTSKKLRDSGIAPETLIGWRTWNSEKFSPLKNPYGIVSTWQDYMIWREDKKLPTSFDDPMMKPQPPPTPPDDNEPFVSPEKVEELRRLTAMVAKSKTIPDYIPGMEEPHEQTEAEYVAECIKIWNKHAPDAGLPVFSEDSTE
jgi:phage replication O-like protein O